MQPAKWWEHFMILANNTAQKQMELPKGQWKKSTREPPAYWDNQDGRMYGGQTQ